ncbi:MAG: glycosyltransferase family 1 protein [Candidatus Nitricoxidivorans perseverans]|uniref:Glycosyltransferase family 1 protein n=1 Tax=Candidatus Nitricoxidivorans perseverans TaxID=2975601 RepID=A0AA49IVA2_9PROT|nr:MAG: glycosyltransferase family 1 protein [Candidatus Nitricoxidivorans perseverans]
MIVGMHVALVTETFPPEVNGVAMTLGRMADGLSRRGHRVQIVRPSQQPVVRFPEHPSRDELLVGGLPIPRYPGLRFGLPAGRALLAAWRATRPDIVHVATEGPLGWSALAAADRLGIPVSSGYHTNFQAYSRHYGIGWLYGAINRYLRHFHNRTRATLVPSRALAERLTRDGFSNLILLARGVDTGLFRPARRSDELRRIWNAGPDTLIAAYVGRIAPEKNLGLVVRGFEAIRQAHPDAKLLFVGDGPQKQALARRHPEHIHAGMRHGEDLAAHYASADIFLFPSLTETFGNVTLEAMASGLGVVAYDCAAAGELIEHGVSGLLAPLGDERRFIADAVRLAADPALLAWLRQHAVAGVARFDWESIHDALAGTFQNIVRGNTKRQ